MLERLPNAPEGREPGTRLRAGGDPRFSTADLTYLLHRHVGIILAALLAGLGIAVLYVLLTKPAYTARAQVLIDVQTPQTLPTRQGEMPLAIDTTQIESQLAIMRSDNLVATVVANLGLAQDPEFGAEAPPSLLQRLVNLVRPSAPGPSEEARRRAVLALQEHLDVRRQGGSFAIDISVRSQDPEKAAKIANSVADTYVADQLTTRARAARQGSEWLEERIDLLRRYMNNAALRVQEFKARRDYRIVGKGERPPAQAQPGDPAAPTDTTTLEELESTATTYRRMYESFLQAYTDSVQRQSYPISNARVITPASKPLTKSHPKTVLALGVGGLLGLLLGFAIALVRQHLDQGVRSAQQIRNEIGVDCLGQLPRIAHPTLRRNAGARSSAAGTRRQAPATLFSQVAGHARALIVRLVSTRLMPQDRPSWHEVRDAPFSPFSQALSDVKLRITMASRRTKPIKTLGVTSAMPGEGKSTVASNLAQLYGLNGARTAVVDMDVRRAVLSRALAPEGTIGLMDVLAGTADVASCLVLDKLAGVAVLPVGAGPIASAPELFASQQMIDLLQWLANDFDMVVIDLPPLELVKDGLALSPLIDGVLVVAEWAETPLPQLADTIEALRQENAHVLGTVLTKMRTGPHRSYRARPYLIDMSGATRARRTSA